jgi:hypothetical protein
MKIQFKILLFILALSISAKAQNLIGFEHTDSLKFQFDVFYQNNAASNLSNDFLINFITNGNLTEELIDESIEKNIHKLNKFGNLSVFSISFLEQHEESSLYLGFEFGNKNIYSATFNKELFEMVFKGNKQFTGINADASNTNYLNFNYNYFSLDISYKISNNILISIKPSFVQSIKYNNVYTNNLKIYTDTSGKYIDFNGDINSDLSNSKSNYGAALGLSIHYKSEKQLIRAEIAGLGFIKYKSLESFEISNFRWEGLYINNIFDSNIDYNFNDSLNRFYNENSKLQDFTVYLPAKLNLEYIYNFHQKFDLGFYTSYQFNIHSDLFMKASLFHHLGKKLHLAYNISYGEFTSFNAGLNILFLQNNWNFELGSRYISSTVFRANLSGIGGFARINYRINK